ncbi:MAG: tol-pal system-associated acyl-CoA thioesterase [Magnetococcales bacterium]|nr:tol-pal system-associated acyl-CoA thioesterase [Magnetococcales bacterium]
MTETNTTKTPFLWPVRVYYEDTDTAGVVYHGNYLKYMERARTEWLRHRGWEQESGFQETGVRFTITHVDIAFKAPARLDDHLIVTAQVIRLGGASLTLEQLIHKEGSDEIITQAEVRIAVVDGDFRPTRFPPALLSRITNQRETP